MTTPWTPPGAELPEPTPAPIAPPPLPKYPTAPPVFHGYPDGGPRPTGPPPSKTMAGWALGLAIFGCSIITWILGVIFAIQVLVESRREQRDHGKGMAIAALVILAGWAVVALFVLTSNAVRDFEVTDLFEDGGEPRDSGVPTRIEVGDCLNDPTLTGATLDDNVSTTRVTFVPCGRPHDLEAFLVSDLLGSAYPGLDELQRRSAEACDPAFKAYVGKAIGRSELAYWVYYPKKQAWESLADHRITCVVGSPGQKTSGTLKDSRR